MELVISGLMCSDLVVHCVNPVVSDSATSQHFYVISILTNLPQQLRMKFSFWFPSLAFVILLDLAFPSDSRWKIRVTIRFILHVNTVRLSSI